MAVRDELQQTLDEQERATALVGALKDRLAQLDAEYDPRRLSPPASLSVRVARATLANAEQRFTDALIMIPDEDEKANARIFRVLQVRADSFFGLREWQNALDRYQEMLILQTNRLAAMARVADCQYALGKRTEAMATYAEVARRRNAQGDSLRTLGKAEAAKRHYDKAARIQKWLAEQEFPKTQ